MRHGGGEVRWVPHYDGSSGNLRGEEEEDEIEVRREEGDRGGGVMSEVEMGGGSE